MDEYGAYQSDEWYDDDEDYGDWDDLYDEDAYEDEDEPEPRPLTVLERFGRWFTRTRIGRLYWRLRYAIYRRYVDVSDLPF